MSGTYKTGVPSMKQYIWILGAALSIIVLGFFFSEKSKTTAYKPRRMYESKKMCPFTAPSYVNQNGGWYYTKKLIQKEHLPFDKGFGQALVQYLGKSKIYDIGAGVGQFEVFSKCSGVDTLSFDGGNNIESFENEHIPLQNDPNFVVPKICWIDASVPVEGMEPLDWVLSIEVGEHIQKSREKIFLDNLVNLSKIGVILSWAVKGQGGYQHINTQNNEYIINEMEKRGLHYDLRQSMYFRSSVSELSWLKNTVMVFKK